ncbi:MULTISPECIES: hypothetical protein [Pseudomonadaceae]|jgi:hypothetical protein|uniref:Uncharacterized protein n=1 Tax=Pseudomonas veronii TaxID=76761 RepID=A0A7Y1FDC8_PSEVE|nr:MULTISPECIES: hypothetical protein [Pseudomonas]MCT9824056.1 hypothetical protein [Pseudomonas veronii]MDD2028484.1 hypothetical protein [Pseudomonas putida]MDX3997735.1 hypothetical protein [Pseudomonas aeruginosa]MDY7555213.1 hypothetical protein [Pseudomonas sp. FG1]MEB0053745.1 hypothetical protein [Pseudomonas sp. FG1]
MASRGQPYTPCKLYIDGADDLSAGDYILTSGGSAYLVQATRPSPSKPERLYLDCLRWPPDQIPEDARCYQLNWYRR